MKPIILLLINRSKLRLEIREQLDGLAQVEAALSLGDVVSEIVWRGIGAVLIDLTDDELDGFGMLNIINSTYPSLPTVLLVKSDMEGLEQFKLNKQNILLKDENFAGNIARALMTAAEKYTENGEDSDKELFASLGNQMTRLRENLRRVEDYTFGELEHDIKNNIVSISTIEKLELTNIGLEGFLRLLREGGN